MFCVRRTMNHSSYSLKMFQFEHERSHKLEIKVIRISRMILTLVYLILIDHLYVYLSNLSNCIYKILIFLLSE